MDLNGVVTTNIHNVTMTQKEYEAWQAMQAFRARVDRSPGRFGFVLVRFSNGQIMVHPVSTHPENGK